MHNAWSMRTVVVVGIMLLFFESCVMPPGGGSCHQEVEASSIQMDSSSPLLRSEWWPMFHHDLGHTGYSSSVAPATNTTLWTYATTGQIGSSPAVSDGYVFVGCMDQNVYCVNGATGELRWQYDTGHYVSSSPAIYENMVYVGSNDLPGSNGSKLYCLNASSGAKLWEYTTGDGSMYGVYSSPAVAEGRVYVGSGDHKVYCCDAYTGGKLWEYSTGYEVASSPAVVNNSVYIGSLNGVVYCLNATTGAERWIYPTQGQIRSSPTVVNGRVYIGSSRMFCLDADTGVVLWDRLPEFLYSSPAVGYDRVFCGSTSQLYCLNATTGWLLWQSSLGAGDTWVWSSPAVADEKVYVGGRDGYIYCFDVWTGDTLWTYPTGVLYFPVFSSPAVANGRIYVGDSAGTLICFGEPNHQPLTPAVIGPQQGLSTVEYTFSTDAVMDPDGDDVYGLWDWGDGTWSGWLGPYSSGQVVSASHSWASAASYEVRVKLRDPYDVESNWSAPHLITIAENTPPCTPDITGPKYGKPGVLYLYTVVATDAQQDDVFYYVEWGDGVNSNWLGPYASGVPVSTSYRWGQKGTYVIQVKAKDTWGAESDWGTLRVIMPTSSQVPFQHVWMRLGQRFPNLFPLLRFFVEST
ncbi:MAG: PQQ-binding-like beta-propeller repeat protein [Candidatus Thermoplasmatota archaeon]|nr:PQQ-binding-like beta-propeller repeat protein [Candidatus Thermoplasmatota archaeon]